MSNTRRLLAKNQRFSNRNDRSRRPRLWWWRQNRFLCYRWYNKRFIIIDPCSTLVNIEIEIIARSVYKRYVLVKYYSNLGNYQWRRIAQYACDKTTSIRLLIWFTKRLRLLGGDQFFRSFHVCACGQSLICSRYIYSQGWHSEHSHVQRAFSNNVHPLNSPPCRRPDTQLRMSRHSRKPYYLLEFSCTHCCCWLDIFCKTCL